MYASQGLLIPVFFFFILPKYKVKKIENFIVKGASPETRLVFGEASEEAV
jgi:hypothetical protein